MTVEELKQYSHADARIGMLEKEIGRLEIRVEKKRREGLSVDDAVLEEIREKKREKKELVLFMTSVEEYLRGIGSFEIRNIMHLYYVKDLTWAQVAKGMNEKYGNKKYTESSCRHKHDRFFKENLKKN